MECIKDKDTRINMLGLSLVILLIIPAVSLALYTKDFIETPFHVNFKEGLMNENIEYKNTTLSSENYYSSYKIKSFSIYFNNIELKYSEKEIYDAFLYQNSTNPSTNEIKDDLRYYSRIFYLNSIETIENLEEKTIRFKVSKGYKIMFIQLDVEMDDNEIISFFRFFDSSNGTIQYLKLYHIQIEKLIYTQNKYSLEYRLEFEESSILDLYDLSYR